ncbi:phosphotransferase family protein [Pseudomonas sp. CT11-2]|uniref:phosphotransferase family protein n=1 Tax=Pseudomonas sp. CT11-2 TaxID=3243023 RepID=UPI0039B083D0
MTKTESSNFSEFHPKRLQTFLRDMLGGLQGEMRLERIGGGQSNPTFFVTFDNRELVLRKKPSGEILPSAHAVDREYRIMTALARSRVPVPETVLYHAEPDIVGTPFYLMERLQGRVFPEYSLPGVSPEHRKAMYASMAQTLADLHQVDAQAIGLSGFGREGNYFARQLARWGSQWEAADQKDNPQLDSLLAWLRANLPSDDETTVCHGDFRLGNLMFHPTEPRVIGVLDWELSTLGHPLADLAYNCIAWHTLPSEYGGIRGLDLQALGIPSQAEYLQQYYHFTQRSRGAEAFHFAFALFRLAVIFEGIAARARSGSAASDNAASVGPLGKAFARRGLELLDKTFVI